MGRAVPGAADAALGHDGDDGAAEPRAAEGEASEVPLAEDDVVDWCRERLAGFRVPQFVRFRAELTRTAVGKIRKHVLRAEFRSPADDREQ